MYQAKVVHPLSTDTPVVHPDVETTLWQLFVAIGVFWKLPDDPGPYRLRFRVFLANRIALNPLYTEFYVTARRVIAQLVREQGAACAFKTIFTQKIRQQSPGPPASELEVTQRYAADEFVAFRLALGSFKAFGAANYCGYVGGENLADEPVPYRPMGTRHES